jgi:hypothetical protein
MVMVGRWPLLAVDFILVLAFRVPTVDNQIVQWQSPLIIIKGLVGSLMSVALFDWLTHNEERGL